VNVAARSDARLLLPASVEPRRDHIPNPANGDTNLAIYDRAVPKLREVSNTALIGAPGLAAMLDDLRVALAP
jgi:hypothetical protein